MMQVTDDKTATLRAQEHGHAPIVLEGGVLSMDGYNGQLSDEQPTLGVNCGMSTGRNAVVSFDRATYNQGQNAQYDAYKSLNSNNLCRENYVVRRLTPTECARLQGMPDWWVDGIENADPTEEEMAFWREAWETYRLAINPKAKPKTDKQIRKWLANPRSDAAEYKMWGNGMALPCVLYVMEGVTKYLNEIKQEEHNDPDN